MDDQPIVPVEVPEEPVVESAPIPLTSVEDAPIEEKTA